MFYFSIKKAGNPLLSTSTSSGTWSYSDEVIFPVGKPADDKPINLACIFGSSGVSANLNLGVMVAPTQAASYRFIGSGSSIMLRASGATSTGFDNKYFVPVIYTHGGTTYQLRNPGCAKLAYQAQKRSSVTFTAQFVLG